MTTAKRLTKAGQIQVLQNERRHAMSSLKESIHEVQRSEDETGAALRGLAQQVRTVPRAPSPHARAARPGAARARRPHARAR